MLVTVTVLLCDGHQYSGSHFLWGDDDGLRVAGTFAKTDDLTVGSEADGGTLVHLELELVATRHKYWEHLNVKLLRHLAVEVHVSVTVVVEEVIGDFFHVIVGPIGLVEEVFAGDIAEGGKDEVVLVPSAVGGHEVGPEVVVHTPNIHVVDERVRHLGGGDDAQRTVLMTMENLGETAFTTGASIIEASSQAVVRHDVSQVVVGQMPDGTDAVTWLAPKFFCSVVAMLHQESTAVDGLVDLVASAVPFGEVRHVLGDVATSIGAEIIDNCIGVVGG